MFRKRHSSLLNSNSEQEIEEVQPKNQTISKRKSIYNLATSLSFLSSIFAVGLLSGTLFGTNNLFDNKILEEACDCYVPGLIAVSVIFGILAYIVAPPKYHFKQLNAYTDDFQFNIKKSKHQKQVSNDGTTHLHEYASSNEVCKSRPEVSAEHAKMPDEKRINLKSFGNTSTISQPDEKDTLSANRSASFQQLSNRYPLACSNIVVPYDGTRKNQTDSEKISRLVDNPRSLQVFKQTSELQNCDPPKNNIVTELVTTRRIRYFSEGSIHSQEELKVKKITTFYRCPQPASQLLEANLVSDKDFSNLSHQSLFAPQQDKVSDVITKMKSLQFYY